jgi:hypothetical protein
MDSCLKIYKPGIFIGFVSRRCGSSMDINPIIVSNEIKDLGELFWFYLGFGQMILGS